MRYALTHHNEGNDRESGGGDPPDANEFLRFHLNTHFLSKKDIAVSAGTAVTVDIPKIF